MSSVTSVQIKWDTLKLDSINKKAVEGLIQLGFDISNQAKRNAPYLTGALRNSIRIQETSDNTVEVVAGGAYSSSLVDYAWLREKGPNRNPSTEHYMENAARQVMSGDYLSKYFKGVI